MALTPEFIGTHNLLVLVGIACLVILASMARYRRPECPECSHCRSRRQEEARQQREAQHDAAHHNWGRCSDPSCSRNRRGD